MNDEPTKVIAFYLPQFHPIPENDAWWGAGFTEWTNVAAATPLFPGHHQPHLPGELGFYDLRVPEVRERQAALARRHGIDGFMYYHYWFGGERILGRVFGEVLQSGRPDFPFALCWVNENWTRAWDAGDNAILVEQTYDEEARARHVEWLVGAFEDPRYIRIGGRPFFAIYRVQSLWDAHGFVRQLRAASRRAGLADPYIVKFDTRSNFDDPASWGCDASAAFLPHGIQRHLKPAKPPAGADRRHHFFRYDDVVEAYCAHPAPAWVSHECVFPGWDNSPRRKNQRAIVVLDNTPERYEQWLRVVYERAPERGGVVFVNAWNEWAEGAHLEPDARWGDRFLRATARVVLGADPPPPAGQLPGAVPPGPSYAELYLDVYGRYVAARRRLTSLEETIRREVDRRTRQLEHLLKERDEENAALARLVEELLSANGAGAREPSATPRE